MYIYLRVSVLIVMDVRYYVGHEAIDIACFRK